MFLPEYSITNNTLKHIANIEYSKAIIENTTLLPNWTKQLINEAQTRRIFYSLLREGVNVDEDEVRRFISKLPSKPATEALQFAEALKAMERMSYNTEITEEDLKKLYGHFSERTLYRNKTMAGKTIPDEILAEVSGLVDWLASLDARETHPVVVAAIFKAKIELIAPFEAGNTLLSDLGVTLFLKISNYEINESYALEEYYSRTKRYYAEALEDVVQQDDFTRWIEYFAEGFSREVSTIAENVKLLARDTKIAKAAGDKVRLSERQERIVAYLQDFGMLQNKDFERLFPSISEDTVLRELKDLMQKGIVVKRGKTKSSRYELV